MIRSLQLVLAKELYSVITTELVTLRMIQGDRLDVRILGYLYYVIGLGYSLGRPYGHIGDRTEVLSGGGLKNKTYRM